MLSEVRPETWEMVEVMECKMSERVIVQKQKLWFLGNWNRQKKSESDGLTDCGQSGEGGNWKNSDHFARGWMLLDVWFKRKNCSPGGRHIHISLFGQVGNISNQDKA
jgi:hypothetical protein